MTVKEQTYKTEETVVPQPTELKADSFTAFRDLDVNENDEDDEDFNDDQDEESSESEVDDDASEDSENEEVSDEELKDLVKDAQDDKIFYELVKGPDGKPRARAVRRSDGKEIDRDGNVADITKKVKGLLDETIAAPTAGTL